MQEVNLEHYIEGLFAESTNEGKTELIKMEIGAMRNSQPPQEPTFVLGQDELKCFIQMKLKDSLRDRVFNHLVLIGDVGDGKTHFLNRIESYFEKNEQFYVIKNRTERSSSFGHSFVKMIVASIFKKYYEEFCESLINAYQKVYAIKSELGSDCDETEIANRLAHMLQVSTKVGWAIYAYNEKKNLRYVALNIMGGNESASDLTRLKITKLNNMEYIEILQVFMAYRRRQGVLIVILDEFEHAYTILTPAAKRNFLISYKVFIDSLAQGTQWPLVLFTAVTEQYEGAMEKAIGELDRALWTRIEHHRYKINRLNITDSAEFAEVFTALARRYELAHDYDIGLDGAQDMRKRMFAYWGEQLTRKNREIISLMLKIMDELRSKNAKLVANVDDMVVVAQDMSLLQTQYTERIKWVEEKCNTAHHNKLPGMVKSGIEELIKEVGGNMLEMDQAKGSKLYFKTKDGVNKFVFIATGKNIAKKFKDCEDFVRETRSQNMDLFFKPYFMYVKTEDISSYLRQNPDIFTVALDSTELYDLVALSYSDENDPLRKMYLENLTKVMQRLS